MLICQIVFYLNNIMPYILRYALFCIINGWKSAQSQWNKTNLFRIKPEDNNCERWWTDMTYLWCPERLQRRTFLHIVGGTSENTHFITDNNKTGFVQKVETQILRFLKTHTHSTWLYS